MLGKYTNLIFKKGENEYCVSLLPNAKERYFLRTPYLPSSCLLSPSSLSLFEKDPLV
jgi:hypothetical protein